MNNTKNVLIPKYGVVLRSRVDYYYQSHVIHVCISLMEYIDVFSGIGGIGKALAPFVKPLLYCEWDKYCQQVLTARMRSNHIDRAPIHSDIKSLHLSPHMKPKMIGGGFPCQDISTAGQQVGMAGNRSSLFFEIMRLVDESPSISHVFLENVANIVKCGMAEVVQELRKRGFNIVWTTRSAASLGAPHQRSRWFCLASKGTEQIDLGDYSETASDHAYWANEWPTRITLKGNKDDVTWDPNWIARSHCLGNTVVPCVVRAAFLELVGITNRLAMVTDAMAPYASSADDLCYPFPEAGIVNGCTFVPLPCHKQQGTHTALVDITVVGAEGKLIKMCNYPTLRRGITHPSNVTERSLHDLPTVLCNTTIALAQLRGLLGVTPERLQGLVVPNVQYLEWLMGYPADWTKIDVPVSVDNVTVVQKASDEISYDDQIVATSKKRIRTRTVVSNTRPKNGMHVFIKDNPGKDVRQIAILWRELPEETKTAYKATARMNAMASTV